MGGENETEEEANAGEGREIMLGETERRKARLWNQRVRENGGKMEGKTKVMEGKRLL